MRTARSVWLSALGMALMAATSCGGDDDDAANDVEVQPATQEGSVDDSPPPATAADTPPTVLEPDDSQPGSSPSVPFSDETLSAVTSSDVTSPGPNGTLALAEIIVLGPDGLAITSFGDAADEAVAAITAVLGAPDEDTGWVEPLTISTCAGTEARAVAWGSLYLYFSDESVIATGSRHLFGYSYGDVSNIDSPPEGLSTPEGIGLATTVEFLRAAYADVFVEAGEEGIVEPNFYVDENLSGRLTGSEDDDLVTVIIGGDPCVVGM